MFDTIKKNVRCHKKLRAASVLAFLLLSAAPAEAKVCFLPSGSCGGVPVKSAPTPKCRGFNDAYHSPEEGYTCKKCTDSSGEHYKCTPKSCSEGKDENGNRYVENKPNDQCSGDTWIYYTEVPYGGNICYVKNTQNCSSGCDNSKGCKTCDDSCPDDRYVKGRAPAGKEGYEEVKTGCDNYCYRAKSCAEGGYVDANSRDSSKNYEEVTYGGKRCYNETGTKSCTDYNGSWLGDCTSQACSSSNATKVTCSVKRSSPTCYERSSSDCSCSEGGYVDANSRDSSKNYEEVPYGKNTCYRETGTKSCTDYNGSWLGDCTSLACSSSNATKVTCSVKRSSPTCYERSSSDCSCSEGGYVDANSRDSSKNYEEVPYGKNTCYKEKGTKSCSDYSEEYTYSSNQTQGCDANGKKVTSVPETFNGKQCWNRHEAYCSCSDIGTGWTEGTCTSGEKYCQDATTKATCEHRSYGNKDCKKTDTTTCTKGCTNGECNSCTDTCTEGYTKGDAPATGCYEYGEDTKCGSHCYKAMGTGWTDTKPSTTESVCQKWTKTEESANGKTCYYNVTDAGSKPDDTRTEDEDCKDTQPGTCTATKTVTRTRPCNCDGEQKGTCTAISTQGTKSGSGKKTVTEKQTVTCNTDGTGWHEGKDWTKDSETECNIDWDKVECKAADDTFEDCTPADSDWEETCSKSELEATQCCVNSVRTTDTCAKGKLSCNKGQTKTKIGTSTCGHDCYECTDVKMCWHVTNSCTSYTCQYLSKSECMKALSSWNSGKRTGSAGHGARGLEIVYSNEEYVDCIEEENCWVPTTVMQPAGEDHNNDERVAFDDSDTAPIATEGQNSEKSSCPTGYYSSKETCENSTIKVENVVIASYNSNEGGKESFGGVLGHRVTTCACMTAVVRPGGGSGHIDWEEDLDEEELNPEDL